MNALITQEAACPSLFCATAQQSGGCGLEDFAQATRLPLGFLGQAGLTEGALNGRKIVRILCRDEAGLTGPTAFQVALTGAKRYCWQPYALPVLYGRDQLQLAWKQGRVALVRHVSDALVLRFLGIPALALLDADACLDTLSDPLSVLTALYLPVEVARTPAVGAWLVRSGLAQAARVFAFPGGDLSAAYAAAPQGFQAAFLAALEGTAPWEPLPAVQSAQAQREEQRGEQAQKKMSEAPEPQSALPLRSEEPLAHSERILDRFAEDLQRGGFAGDVRSAKAVFLSVVSRFLDLPVSVALKGPSAGGKSYLLKTVLAHFPQSEYHAVSSLSPKALAYMTQPLSHRMLVIAEQDGAQAKGVEYLLRTLLSEGRIVYEVPVNSGGVCATQQRVVEGPTGLLLTTTRLRLHPENETRMLSLEITDTPEQTRAIFRAQAAEAQGGETTAAQDYAEWHTLQEGLEQGDHTVVIPFADALAERMPAANAVRLRRDFPRLLQMIKAHALLHQASRERDAANRIIATIADYEVVYDLMAGPMAVEMETAVPDEIRATVEATRRLAEGGRPPALPALARELGLDKSSVSRRVSQAVALGYLRNLEPRKGLPARLLPGEALPNEEEALPRPEAVKMALR